MAKKKVRRARKVAGKRGARAPVKALEKKLGGNREAIAVVAEVVRLVADRSPISRS